MLVEFVLISLTILILWLNLRKPTDTPPGYWGLPLIGYIPIFETNTEKILTDLRKKYGDVVSWRIGTQHFVFVFDFKLIKEALSGPDFADRPPIKVFGLMELGDEMQGILFSNGMHWHNLRRFSLRHLRDLGMGKSHLVSAVQFEANEMVNELKKQAGKPAPFPQAMTIPVLNVIWQMVASRRYDLNDEEILEFEKLIEAIQNSLSRLVIPDLFPWIKKIIPQFILNKLLRYETRICLSNKMEKFLMRIVDEHRKNLDMDDPKDYIAAYLIEMEKQKGDPSSKMSITDLLYTIGDLFPAGSETTTASLQWAIFYLATYPEIQKKLQKEIDEIMPKGIAASLDLKASLPYTEAFIHELLRCSKFIPFGFIHTCPSDANIGGYRIPKDSIVLCTSFSCHDDPKYFASPKEFRPERFLNEEGKFVNPKEGFLPFGIGRRQCLGEALARMELFVFLTTLVQNLSFSAPPGETIDLAPVVNNPLANFPNKNQNILVNVR